MATASEITKFIQTLGGLAVQECNRRIAAGEGFVLPSVCIAQSALETGWGTAGLMTRANAFFGIKAGGSWTGAVYNASTWEVANGEAYNTTANFRAYGSLAESVADYYNLIASLTRYSGALSYGSAPAAWKSPKECITAIWAGGYATDTLYVEKIMSTINARGLTAYDAKITGVSDGTVTPTATAIIFKASELVQGSLVLADSGRSFTNDETDLTAVSVKWDNAIDVPVTGTFNIKGLPENIQFTMAYTDAERAHMTIYNVSTISMTEGTKMGFMLKNKEGGTLLLSDLKNVEITLVNADLPDGVLIDTAPLAHFVKIS